MVTALEGLRVLDLTEREGQLCGRLLADLGAEVIKIEPPIGDGARHTGPFAGETPNIEASLLFANLNTNKKSVTLDLTTQKGRETLRGLARNADVIVDTFLPGKLKDWGLDHDSLRKHNPGLVTASITGFGLTGPYSTFKAPSIVCAAMGGVMYLCGSPDSPPLAEPQDVPYDLASTFAAYGILLALRHRQRTGQGQQVEVACQEVLAAQQHIVVNYSANATILERVGSRSPIGGGMPYGVYPASDGYCHLVVINLSHWRNLVQWMGNPDVLNDPIWDNRHVRNASPELIEPMTIEFTSQFAKADLFSQGQQRHITVGSINRPDQFLQDQHVLERDMWVTSQHPVIGVHKLLRPPFRMSETPTGLFRPAPLLGQHNNEILKDDGHEFPADQGAKTTDPHSQDQSLPLHGIRVLDFSQAIAGPFLTRILAEQGAEVIKVESSTHQQRGRASPGLDPRIVLQQKVTFADMNRNKRSISVDMGSEEGREVIKKLVPMCDVVVENFSPRVMENWGLGYDALRKMRSDIIMVRLPGFGLSGPYRDYVGLAAVAMSITGMYYLWSYPDSAEPAGPPVWTPDYLSAGFASVALMAALHHRDRTDQGQLIELSQLDATAFALGSVYMDYLHNGHVSHPIGNRNRYLAPHGAYRCKGQDAWCTIAVRNDDEWRSLCQALGSPRWADDEKFETNEERLAHQEELDLLIEEWTRDHTPHQAMQILQKAGVPAGAVMDGEQLFQSPHTRERGFIVPVNDPDTGPVDYPGVFVRLSEAPSRVEQCHQLGEDNKYVFGDLLKMPGEEVKRLKEAGVLV